MTPERKEKLWKVIRKRQKNLAVVLENIQDPHNIFACLRSCDAVGVNNIYIIHPTFNIADLSTMGKRSSAGAKKWLNIHVFREVVPAFAAIRQHIERIYTTNITENAVSLYQLNLAKSIALVFGNERVGVSDEACQLADGNFVIPQAGMIQSLNISVACAVSLYEAYRQRNEKGMYQESSYSPQELQSMFLDWKQR
ncbi:MAG: TrmH family RNA methyltransferase [Chitinophagales bacterium]|nr:RNA methyltransferase [Bacteroidota bacterium]MCB9044056.1 RNA methyltransferase [Chitinophagales bacterium]